MALESHRGRRKSFTIEVPKSAKPCLINQFFFCYVTIIVSVRLNLLFQRGQTPFNRASLLNVGFIEAMKRLNYACLIFHDVDLLPEDDRNLYMCDEVPTHMSATISKFNYK
ncbi:unnamed protein product [Dibothriocephalus latus]|uniref:Galactosyltransferase N-terminal domain-containing protein n=1 Tax=Dibothriocephalus latus TaxID=60516 RepID=A0A3P7MPM2_DIBLA|nr:unnamed protein product [Dibothriocephalus latus]